MSIQFGFQMTLILATILCSLITGFLFAFATIVMPGIKTLSDREFIRSFQAIDGVIQNNQPVFVFVWLGSVLTLVASAILSWGQLEGSDRWLMIAAVLTYLLTVQLPTFTINVPLNNKLQTLKVDQMQETDLKNNRLAFEKPWILWNLMRTMTSTVVSVLLMVLLFQQ